MDQSILLLSSTVAEVAVDPMLFCYTCNRTFHVKCVGLDLESIKKVNGPYICFQCKSNPLNEVAVAYYESGDWGQGIEKRRAQFFRSDSIRENPHLLEEQLTDDEFDREDQQSFMSMHEKADSLFNTISIEKFNEQKKELLKLAEEYKKYVEKATKAEQKASFDMAQLKKEMENVKREAQEEVQNLRNELAKFHNQSTGAIPKLCTSATSSESAVITAEMLMRSIYGSRGGPNTIAMDDCRHGDLGSGPYTSERPGEVRGPNTTEPSALNNGNESMPIDQGNLTWPERVLLSSTRAQMENSEAQRAMSNALTADIRRKSLPKISKFKGEPKGWIRFKQEVQRYKDAQCFTEFDLKMYIYGALEGVALRRVQDMINFSSLEQVMNILEVSFGHSPAIIKACEDDILRVKIKGDIMRNDVVYINSLIQSYFTACRYANVDTLNSNMLANHILSQLSGVHKLFFRQHYRVERPNDITQLPDLNVLFTFFEDLAKDLETRTDEGAIEKKSKPAQIHSITFKPTETSRQSDDFKYEMKDNKKAQYIGYDLQLVKDIPKRCLCCDKTGHYTVECYRYKGLSEPQKLDFVTAKSLCRNCLLTTSHKAGQCSLKLGCGYKIYDTRCSQKHHITLHNVINTMKGKRFRDKTNAKRRSNSRNNQQRAVEKLQTSAVASQSKLPDPKLETSSPNASNIQPTVNYNGFPITNLGKDEVTAGAETSIKFNYNVSQQHHIMTSSRRTVKVFKNIFYGPNGMTGGYSIGDSAAEITLMREDLREQLGIEGVSTTIDLQWTDGSIKKIPAKKVSLTIIGIHKNAEKIVLNDCYAIEALSLPPRSLDVDKLKQQFPYLKNADFESYKDAIPILLIGSPHASCFEATSPIIEGGEGKPVALKSKLGWSIYGGTPENFSETPKEGESIYCNQQAEETYVSNDELNESLAFFSSIENLGIQQLPFHRTEDEKKALKILKEEMKVLPHGSIEIPLLWNLIKGKIPKLPNNFELVYKRQLAQEKKLANRPEELHAYNENFKELIREGYVRAATNEDIDGNWENVWYLPMSLVVNANKSPIKYRNVYDASAKYKGVSLNEMLLMGPNLIVDMLQPLFRMRQNQIAFTCDVKSMFHRVYICLRDQQCQRILWRPSPNEPMQIYIQQVMLFGPKCSPCASQYVKNETAMKWTERYPEAATTLQKYTYMDDVLTSETSVDKAAEIALQCIDIMKSINWDLIGFQSNSKEFLRKLPATHIKGALIPILSGEKENVTTKVLGCAWDTESDCFVFQLGENAFIRLVKECDHRPSKRDQCSTIARIFDVLGFIAHYIIRGRILTQRSWKRKIDWDDEIAEEDYAEWKKWIQDIEQITKLKIPRKYVPIGNLNQADAIELHVFCDAGKEAFAAAAYFVASFKGLKYTSLVMAKAKVTPIRLASKTEIQEMPKLELMACLIAARLGHTIAQNHPEIKFERFMWTDSQIVLRWITNENHQLQKFAAAPIDEIVQLTKRHEWLYVPSKLNPADIATKFAPFDFSNTESVWFKGPEFIRQGKSQWPSQPEMSKTYLVNVINLNSPPFEPTIQLPSINSKLCSDTLVDKFRDSVKGNWIKLLRATARALKILIDGLFDLWKSDKLEDRNAWMQLRETKGNFTMLDPLDLERAELFIIRKMQREAYAKDYALLLQNKPTYNKELIKLNIFMDNQHVIRINSRVNLKAEVYPQKYAPLVPREHTLTKILLMFYHKKFNHVCIESQQAEVRSKVWIPQLRAALKSVKFNCNYCSFMRTYPKTPLMAELPDFRVNPTLKPFQVTGVDCTGALEIRKGNFKGKVYILLFTCTLTRFVHVHLLDKMDTLGVLEAIVVFWASHGPVFEFISDNGRNFVGAARRLSKDQVQCPSDLLKKQQEALSQELAEKLSVKWRFIPAYSPWFGGFYESLIKQIKKAIEATVKGRKLSKVELNIAIHEAAHRLNCRPLTHNSVSSEDEPILTPHLLAKNRDGWPLLPSMHTNKYPDSEVADRFIYHKGRAVADMIMKRFVTSYLPTLTKRDKWYKDSEDLKIGDLVLIIDPNQTRRPWQRAKIADVHTGRDGRVRVVDVELPDGEIRQKYSAQRVAKIELKQIENAM